MLKLLHRFPSQVIVETPLKPKIPHGIASRAQSSEVVMGTLHPSPFCHVAPLEKAMHL